MRRATNVRQKAIQSRRTSLTRGKLRRFSSDSQRKAVFANIQAHQGLVHKAVAPYARKMPHLKEDLVSAGNIGLLSFAHRYNPSRGAFSTGATQAIRSRVQREVFKGSTVRVPERPLRKMAKQGSLPYAVSLKEVMHTASGGGIEQAEARATIQRLVRNLPLRDQKVVQMRYIQDQPLGVVAKRLKIKSQQVRKIQMRAMKTLQQSAKG